MASNEGNSSSSEVDAWVTTILSLQSMLREVQTGTISVEVWQKLTLILLAQLNRKRMRSSAKDCLNPSVLTLLLRVLPKALPEAAPVLNAITTQTQRAMLRPPSSLQQIMDEHILAALPEEAYDAPPNAEGMQLLLRLSTAVMSSALSATVGLSDDAQDTSSGSQNSDHQQSVQQDPFHAADIVNESVLDSRRLAHATSEGMQLQMLPFQQQPQQHRQQQQPLQPPEQPPWSSSRPPQPKASFQSFQQVLLSHQDALQKPLTDQRWTTRQRFVQFESIQSAQGCPSTMLGLQQDIGNANHTLKWGISPNALNLSSSSHSESQAEMWKVPASRGPMRTQAASQASGSTMLTSSTALTSGHYMTNHSTLAPNAPSHCPPGMVKDDNIFEAGFSRDSLVDVCPDAVQIFDPDSNAWHVSISQML